jgi:CrcB protein
VTSKRIEDAALPIDPDLDQPATPADGRPDRRAGARPDVPAAAPPAAPPAGPRLDRDPDRGPERDPDRSAARGRERRPGAGSGGRWRGLGTRLRPAVLAAIAVGGALGGAARYGMERALPTAPDAFPWATFAVNVSGSLALAVLLVFVLEIWPPTRYVRPFAAIGFLGAYTTFSTWMVETDELVAHHRPGLAAGYLAASLGAGLAAVSLGLVVDRAVLARRSRAGAPAGRS